MIKILLFLSSIVLLLNGQPLQASAIYREKVSGFGDIDYWLTQRQLPVDQTIIFVDIDDTVLRTKDTRVEHLPIMDARTVRVIKGLWRQGFTIAFLTARGYLSYQHTLDQLRAAGFDDDVEPTEGRPFRIGPDGVRILMTSHVLKGHWLINHKDSDPALDFLHNPLLRHAVLIDDQPEQLNSMLMLGQSYTYHLIQMVPDYPLELVPPGDGDTDPNGCYEDDGTDLAALKALERAYKVVSVTGMAGGDQNYGDEAVGYGTDDDAAADPAKG